MLKLACMLAYICPKSLERYWNMASLVSEQNVRVDGRVMEWIYLFIYITRSYAALRAADLDWIIGPGYSLSGYILEKNH